MEDDSGSTSAIQRYCVPCLLGVETLSPSSLFAGIWKYSSWRTSVRYIYIASRGLVVTCFLVLVAFDISTENPIRDSACGRERGRYRRASASSTWRPSGVLEILAAVNFSFSETIGSLSSRAWAVKSTFIARRSVYLTTESSRYSSAKREPRTLWEEFLASIKSHDRRGGILMRKVSAWNSARWTL